MGYSREYPLFSLCGLNCGLCSRYHINGPSRCPGCGGEHFSDARPGCSVITCSKRHDMVQYCFQCTEYPCSLYKKNSRAEYVITTRYVLSDFSKAREKGIRWYQDELEKRAALLRYLLENYNDGRKKQFYCLAVQLLDESVLSGILRSVEEEGKGSSAEEKKNVIQKLVSRIKKAAEQEGISLKLRGRDTAS